MRRFTLPAAAALSALLATACATSTVSRERTTMTPAQLAEMGLECRTEKPMGSIRPQTICASPEAWAAEEAETSYDSGLLLDQLNSTPNGRFSGN